MANKPNYYEYYKDTGVWSLMRKMSDRVVWSGIIYLFVFTTIEIFFRDTKELVTIITTGLSIIGLGFGAKYAQKGFEIGVEKKEIENGKNISEEQKDPQ